MQSHRLTAGLLAHWPLAQSTQIIPHYTWYRIVGTNWINHKTVQSHWLATGLLVHWPVTQSIQFLVAWSTDLADYHSHGIRCRTVSVKLHCTAGTSVLERNLTALSRTSVPKRKLKRKISPGRGNRSKDSKRLCLGRSKSINKSIKTSWGWAVPNSG